MFVLILNVPVHLSNGVQSVETAYTGELYYANQKQNTNNVAHMHTKKKAGEKRVLTSCDKRLKY